MGNTLHKLLLIAGLSGSLVFSGPPVQPQAIAEATTVTQFFGTFENRGKCANSALGLRLNRQPNMCQIFSSWSQKSKFPRNTAIEANKRGAAIMVTWQPWNPKKGKKPQSFYSLEKISSGKFDSYIASWADQIKSLGFPVYLRFAHEMNGPWYPWGSKSTGKQAARFVSAWRHVHKVFKQHGATNVRWVWAPNAPKTPRDLALKPFYPGDQFVDYVGPVGYARKNGDTFSSVFNLTLSQVKKFTQRPILISETAALKSVKKPEAFIKSFFKGLQTKRIVGFVWFDSTLKNSRWHLKTNKELNAFRIGLDRWRSL